MPDFADTPNFRPDYCLKVMKRTAVACSIIALSVLAILIAVDPSRSSCPGWMMQAKGGTHTSLWFLYVVFTVFPTLWVWYVVLRWDAFSQREREVITGERQPPFYGVISPYFLPFLNMDQLFVIICVGWCLVCTIILWAMIDYCTELPSYLAVYS